MKYRFTNGTICDKRKGKEFLAPTAINHPDRESVIVSEPSPLPVLVKKHEPPAKISSKSEEVKEQVLKLLAEREKEKARKAAAVPKSRILSMNNANPTPDTLKEYQDVLALLLAKK